MSTHDFTFASGDKASHIVLPLLAYAASAAGLFGDSEGLITIIIGIASVPLYFVPSIVGWKKKSAGNFHSEFLPWLDISWLGNRFSLGLHQRLI